LEIFCYFELKWKKVVKAIVVKQDKLIESQNEQLKCCDFGDIAELKVTDLPNNHICASFYEKKNFFPG